MASRVRGTAHGRIRGAALAGVSIGVMVQVAVAQAAQSHHLAEPVARLTAPASATTEGPVRVAIPGGPLEDGLAVFTEQAGVKLVYPTEMTAALETRGVEGTFPPLDALTRLLEGTGLSHRPAGTSTITLVNPRYVQLDAGVGPGAAVTLDELEVRGQGGVQARGAVTGQPPRSGVVGQPPVPYAGGQVGSGTRVGFLGNRSVLKTPFNVAGYTDKLIQDQQARTVGDVLLNNPSVRNDAPPFSERDSFFIRGFSVTGLDTAFDGLFYIANPRRHFPEGLERVEVLLGPTALLSGGVGRVGGTINLVPKRAYDEPLTRITTAYVSDAQTWTHVDLGRRFGQFNEWGVRFNGAYRNGATPLDRNEIEVGVAALGLDYRGDGFRASLDLTHSTQNITAPTSLFNAAAPGIVIPRAPRPTINTASTLEYIDSRYDMAAARVEYDILPETTVYAAGGFSRYNEDFLLGSYTIQNSAGAARNDLAVQPLELRGRTAEVGFRSQFRTGFLGHQINVAAVEAENDNFSRGFFPITGLPSFQTNIYNPTLLARGSVSVIGLPRSERQPLFTSLNVRSFSFADTLSLGDDRFLLTLGGRFQEIELNSYVTRPVATQGQQNFGYLESRFSPAIALVFSPFDNVSFYANFIEALIEGPSAPATAVNNSAIFPPIVSRQKEVGVKVDFGTVAATASLFEIELPNAFTDPATRIFSVSGLQRNRGVELTVFGEPLPGMRLLGGVSFFDAQLVNVAPVTVAGRATNVNGNAAPGVPDTQLNLYGEYDLPPWLAPGLTFTGRAIYTSSVFYDQANTQTVPDWTRFDAGLRYTFEGANGKPVVMRAIVENLFDDAYWQNATRGFLAVGAPRTFILSATVDF